MAVSAKYEGQDLQLLYAFANVNAATTDATLIAAIAQRRIMVLKARFKCAGTATTLVFQSNASAIGPSIANGVNGGEVWEYDEHGWITTNGGEALKCTTGAGSATGIELWYILVP